MTVSQVLNQDVAYVRVKPPGGSFGPWGYWKGPFVLSDVYQDKISVSTPGFRQLKRSQLPMHPYRLWAYRTQNDYTTFKIDFVYDTGAIATNEYKGPAGAFDIFSTLSGDIDPPVAVLEHKAISRLLSDLSLTAGSAGVTMAEMDKTLQLVGDTTRRLAKAYRSLRRGNVDEFAMALGLSIPKRRAQALRSDLRRQTDYDVDPRKLAADTWLEFTYGWKPLVSDVYSQSQNLAEALVERQGVVRTGRGSAKETRITTRKFVEPGHWNNLQTTEVTMRKAYVVRYRLRDGTTSWISRFGLNNPMLIAWEIVPFSFVADWFLPIGNFLEELTATSGLEFHDGVKVTSTTAISSSMGVANIPLRMNTSPNGWQTPSFLTGGNARNVLRTGKVRETLIDFPSPRLPAFKNPLSVAHATSGIALLYSAFHGGVKNYVSR